MKLRKVVSVVSGYKIIANLAFNSSVENVLKGCSLLKVLRVSLAFLFVCIKTVRRMSLLRNSSKLSISLQGVAITLEDWVSIFRIRRLA